MQMERVQGPRDLESRGGNGRGASGMHKGAHMGSSADEAEWFRPTEKTPPQRGWGVGTVKLGPQKGSREA